MRDAIQVTGLGWVSSFLFEALPVPGRGLGHSLGELVSI